MHNPPRILIVDDDPNFLEIFSARLSASGYEIETAENGLEAVQKTKNLHPDLILMDVQMPTLNGVDALFRIKEDPLNKDVRIIFLTVLGDPRTEVQEIHRRLSKEVGAVGYLKKTDDLAMLVENIQSMFAATP